MKQKNIELKIANTPISKKWIRFNAHFNCLQKNWDAGRMTGMGIRLKKDGQVVKENRILIDKLFYKQNEQDIYVDLKIEKSQL